MSRLKLTLKKPTGAQVRQLLLDNVFWIVGGALYAAAINMFAQPNQIAMCGVTGLSLVINYLTGFPVGAANFLMNVPLVILAWFFVGKKFVYKTLWVIALMSIALDSLVQYLPQYTGDRLLAAIFCGIISGAGLALIMLRGATSGGTDIVGRLVRVRWPHMSMGRVILIADAITIVIAAIAFRSVESAMYAAVVIILSSTVLDYILYGVDKGKMLMIVTQKADELSKAIIQNLDRGVTILPVKGAYTGEEKSMLVIAVRNNEVVKVNRLARQIDNKTFTIISDAGEILGNGFKTDE